MYVALIVLTALFFAALIWLIVRQQAFHQRRLEHRERLAAIDRGIAPPTEGDPAMNASALSPRELFLQRLHWFRLVNLGLGLLLVFGGGGLLTAFIISEDPELAKLWSIGLVPSAAGVGLLLFAWVARILSPEE